MQITKLKLPEVKILEQRYFEDFRGYYCETYSKRTFQEHDLSIDFVQDNHSFSLKKGTLRGIHFQLCPKPQLKLVRCTVGRVMDYAVDLRKNSPTYKQWVSVELSAENRKQILIPRGFGHAFITLEDHCEVQYKVDELYYPEYDRAIKWNDPDININWNITNPIISEKDMKAPMLPMSDVNFTMENCG